MGVRGIVPSHVRAGEPVPPRHIGMAQTSSPAVHTQLAHPPRTSHSPIIRFSPPLISDQALSLSLQTPRIPSSSIPLTTPFSRVRTPLTQTFHASLLASRPPLAHLCFSSLTTRPLVSHTQLTQLALIIHHLHLVHASSTSHLLAHSLLISHILFASRSPLTHLQPTPRPPRTHPSLTSRSLLTHLSLTSHSPPNHH